MSAGTHLQLYFQLLRVDCFSTSFGAAVEETPFDAACSVTASQATETTAGREHRRSSGPEPAESLQWVSSTRYVATPSSMVGRNREKKVRESWLNWPEKEVAGISSVSHGVFEEESFERSFESTVC